MYWVYMLECADGSLYTGWTKEIGKRLAQHNAGKGSKYVRSRLPARLVYTESLVSKSEAMRRECTLKKLTRAEKIALIAEWKAGKADKQCGLS
ncbi:MAG: GIY-YIG nuclease family protein [Christensenellales bacterium]|jgi:putative endonuclease